jgi:hypothetical protein
MFINIFRRARETYDPKIFLTLFTKRGDRGDSRSE